MSDFTFTVGNGDATRVGQWSAGVMPAPDYENVDTQRASDVGERPRARRSNSTLGVRGLFDGPPIGEQPRYNPRQATPAFHAPPPRAASMVGGGQSTARPERPTYAQSHVYVSPPLAPDTPPPPNGFNRGASRRAPTPYPEPLPHVTFRDETAAARRGYISSEAGVTDLDDPVPVYTSRQPSLVAQPTYLPPPVGPHTRYNEPGRRTERYRADALSAYDPTVISMARQAHADAAARDLRGGVPRDLAGAGYLPVFEEAVPDGAHHQTRDQALQITPDDSVSSSGRSRRSSGSRHRRDSATSMTTGSTVSLTDSSVDRIARRLTDAGIGGVVSTRRTLDTVPEEAATSAKNRRRMPSQKVGLNPETFVSGVKLMVGAQDVRRDSRGNLILVKNKK